MAFLVRALKLDLWPEEFKGAEADIPADCVTGEVKTEENELSVWRISTKDELPEAILGIVAEYRQLTDVGVVLLDEDELAKVQFTVTKHEVKSRVSGVGERHHDLVQLNHSLIGRLAFYIIRQIEAGQSETITIRSIVALLYKARADGRLDFNKLKPDFRTALEAQYLKYTV